MSDTMTVTRKKRRRGAGRREPGRDAVRLLSEASALLRAAGAAVTADELMSVAVSAPRTEGESHSPPACRRCAAALIAAEGVAASGDAYRRFKGLVRFFLEEMRSWSRTRRARAEDALARMLGE